MKLLLHLRNLAQNAARRDHSLSVSARAARFALLTLALAATCLAQAPGDWPLYSRDPAGQRFSPLTQINKDNVARLTTAYTVALRSDGGGPTAEVTPIVVNGVMYLPAGNKVLALEAHTGKEVWTYTMPEGAAPPRGVAYWPGDRNNPPRIIFTNGGDVMSAPSAGPAQGPGPKNRMFAVNAATGRIDPGFGREGVVELEVGYSGVPTIFRNLVLLGAAVPEKPQGLPGDARAYDARTGRKLWDFHTVPREGEKFNETWENGSWRNRSGVNMWGFYMTADVERGILYIPVGGPAANFWGGDRPGSNLFANSLVAVDAETGKYKWHFQSVHHDIWDIDQPAAPGLLDVRRNGRTIPALALVGKTGLMFILNRVTGEPIFGVEERAVPKGDVPGEYYAPTQPFPVTPPPLARIAYRPEDLVTAEDTSPEHAAACRELVEKYGGFPASSLYTPFPLKAEQGPVRVGIQFPGMTGGSNWGGTATDPRTNYVFVQTHDQALIGWMEKVDPKAYYGRGTDNSNQLYDRGSLSGPGPYAYFTASARDAEGKIIGTWPCQKPPWAALTAVNANTGEIAWRVPLGLVDGLPEAKQPYGAAGSAGPIATAGGLVFIGATTDRRFRAFDSATGRELWAPNIERNINANPITYQGRDGRQYVAVVATDTLMVFGLPQ